MSEEDEEMASSSSDDEPVEVAVLARGRRATAGRRLTTLTGQAADDDAAFWGHDTWGDADDNESFRESDEDSEQRVDTFDSDFDDDEESGAEEEKQNAQEAEAEIARIEREEKKKKKGTYAETKKKATTRRIFGEGLNAGIVLNMPGQAPRAQPMVRSASAKGARTTAAPSSAAAASLPFATLAATRKPRRATQQSKYSSRFRSAKQLSSDNDSSQQQQQQQHQQPQPQHQSHSSSTTGKRKLTAAERAGDKKKPKRFTQEELLLEAVHETEPENRRWLLQRQRNQNEKDKAHQQALDRKNQSTGKLIERYTSRRGALNLIHFPAMDHVPAILKPQPAPPKRPTNVKCVITGKPARYRDPKTGLPYYDVAAFRELRRRQTEVKTAPQASQSTDLPSSKPESIQAESTQPSTEKEPPQPQHKKGKAAKKDAASTTTAREKPSKKAPKKASKKSPADSTQSTTEKETTESEPKKGKAAKKDVSATTDKPPKKAPKKPAAPRKRKAAAKNEKGNAKVPKVASQQSSAAEQNGQAPVPEQNGEVVEPEQNGGALVPEQNREVVEPELNGEKKSKDVGTASAVSVDTQTAKADSTTSLCNQPPGTPQKVEGDTPQSNPQTPSVDPAVSEAAGASKPSEEISKAQ